MQLNISTDLECNLPNGLECIYDFALFFNTKTIL